MSEPIVELERFRKDVDQLTWKKFQFNKNTPDLCDLEIPNEKIDEISHSSSDSDSSSTDSEEEKEVTAKKGPMQNDIGMSEEIFVGWTVGPPTFSMQFVWILLLNQELAHSKALRGDPCVGLDLTPI